MWQALLASAPQMPSLSLPISGTSVVVAVSNVAIIVGLLVYPVLIGFQKGRELILRTTGAANLAQTRVGRGVRAGRIQVRRASRWWEATSPEARRSRARFERRFKREQQYRAFRASRMRKGGRQRSGRGRSRR